MEKITPQMRTVYELVHTCWPLFKGKPPEVQGAALADLLAIWLAGHVVVGDQRKTDAIREKHLQDHMVAVRDLIPIEYKARIEPQLKARKH